MSEHSCRIAGCTRAYLARGMCDTHYRAFRRGRIEAPTDLPPKRPRDGGHKKQCPECGADFLARTAGRKFCSTSCSSRNKKSRHPTKYTPPAIDMRRTCDSCARTFERTSRYGPTPQECPSCRSARRCAANLSAGYAQAHYIANQERYRELGRAWKAANREFVREASVRHGGVRRARMLGTAVVEFSADQLAARVSMFGCCWMCGAPWTEIDHVKPLSKNGPHILANLRPACTPCNRRKSSTWKGVAHAMSMRSRRFLAA